MNELKLKIHEKKVGLITSLSATTTSPLLNCQRAMTVLLAKGRMHKVYLEKTNPLLLNHLILTSKLHTYLADLDEQSRERYRLIVHQMTANEGVTEDLKRQSLWAWIEAMNSIANRAEKLIKSELINV